MCTTYIFGKQAGIHLLFFIAGYSRFPIHQLSRVAEIVVKHRGMKDKSTAKTLIRQFSFMNVNPMKPISVTSNHFCTEYNWQLPINELLLMLLCKLPETENNLSYYVALMEWSGGSPCLARWPGWGYWSARIACCNRLETSLIQYLIVRHTHNPGTIDFMVGTCLSILRFLCSDILLNNNIKCTDTLRLPTIL